MKPDLYICEPDGFNCQHCGQHSQGPFTTTGALGDVEWPPHCRNDDCPEKWWNRVLPSQKPVQIRNVTMADIMTLQALAKKN